MNRALVLPDAVTGSQLCINIPREVHHLRNVLRVKKGEPVECTDGQGYGYRGIIARILPDAVWVDIRERFESQDSLRHVTLAQALVKPDRFEWGLEKATELGVSRIVPLVTQRTVIRLSAAQAQAKRERWQRLAEAAMKQCGRTTAVSVEPVERFSSFVGKTRDQAALLPTLAGKRRPIAEALAEISRHEGITVLIGPEGDFSPDEVDKAIAWGALPVSLGPLVLRSETAAAAVLALLRLT